MIHKDQLLLHEEVLLLALRDEKGTIASGTMYQYALGGAILAELLLKDPALITVDPRSRRNTLHFDPIPTDAKMLLPIDIPAFESRQIWITYRIPNGATPGRYRGTITIRDSQGFCATVPVSIRVPAWDLAPSPMIHGLYYGRRMPPIKTVEEEEARQLKPRLVYVDDENGIVQVADSPPVEQKTAA